MVNIPALIGGVILAIAGAWGVRSNVRRLGQAWTARDTPVSDVSEVRPGDGWVKVEGTARAVEDDTLDTLTRDRDAVVRVLALQRQTRRTTNDDRPTWKTKERAVDVAPFHVEDDTGAARVEVPVEAVDTSYQLLIPGHKPHTTSFMLEPDTAPVSGGWTRSVVDDIFDHELEDDRNYRLREGIVEDGETAYVAGWAEAGESTSGADVTITGEPAPRKMIVADRPESEAESFSFLRGGLFMAVTLAVLLAGLGLVGFGLTA